MVTLSKQNSVVQQISCSTRPASPTSVAAKVEERIIGMHLFGNLYDIDPKIATDKELIRQAVLKAVNVAKMTLVEHKAWNFGGKKGGVSVIALVTESHIAIHTWNEYKYATVDIYTCGKASNPEAGFDYLVSILKPKKVKRFYADRSS